MIQEYYRMPEATLKAFRNLWFHTGDRGRMDEDGRFYFVDRMKDAIRRRGENISSLGGREVDRRPRGGAGGRGDRRPVRADRGGGAGRRRAQAGPRRSRPRQLLDHCQDRMAHFAVPRYVRFADELPKNQSQRIEKFRLRELGVDRRLGPHAHGYEVRR